jgi:hypothetical protein
MGMGMPAWQRHIVAVQRQLEGAAQSDVVVVVE